MPLTAPYFRSWPYLITMAALCIISRVKGTTTGLAKELDRTGGQRGDVISISLEEDR